MNIYHQFWSTAWGLDYTEILTSPITITSAGRYLEKHSGKYVFLFTDLPTGHRVLAADEQQIENILNAVSIDKLTQLKEFDLRDRLPFANFKLAFEDIDFGFENPSDFRPFDVSKYAINRLSIKNEKEILDFLKTCSEDDADTLDLEFENDVVWGIMEKGSIAGLARSTVMKNQTQLNDVTILVSPQARGQGLSTPLMSKLIESILQKNQSVKYRVAASNSPSLAIARKLGLNPMSKLIAWGC